MIAISDFKYIYDLARCSKCQMFTVLKSTNKLYGANEDSCCIHEIDIPFEVNTDLIFRFDDNTKNVINNYESFFIPDKFSWIILPDAFWSDYINDKLVLQFDYESGQYVFFNKESNTPIPQIQMKESCNDFNRANFDNQLEGLFNRMRTLGKAETFIGVHNHPSIKSAFDSKISAGRFLCNLTNDNINVLFYFYKGLFSLAKADTLDIDIRFDLFNTREFLALFKPKKKKNPLISNHYGVPFREQIYCMFINII